MGSGPSRVASSTVRSHCVPNREASRDRGIKRHSAYRSRSVVVEYRWHPLHGQRVPLFRRVGRGADALVHLDVPAGISRECPAWMCDAAQCQEMDLGSPKLCLQALIELRRVLSDHQVKTFVRPPSAERSSGPLPIVEGSGEANDATDGAPIGAGAAKGASNSMAHGDTGGPDRHARRPAARGAGKRRGPSARWGSR